jgi:membrane protein DedA with SNARE-associated domain
MHLASVLSLAAPGNIQESMQVAFYPVLLSLLVLASLGVPIPEDIPLIVSGMLLRTHPGIASWPGTLLVAMTGIMAGDLILFRLGRRWRPSASTATARGSVSSAGFSWACGPRCA